MKLLSMPMLLPVLASTLLAEAFPSAEGLMRLLDGSLLDELKEVAPCLPYICSVPASLDECLTKQTEDEISTMYAGLFEVNASTPLVSMLERTYGQTPEQKLWEELLRFYSFFGLDFSKGGSPEQADHLLTELGFMHYLCFLEAGSQQSCEDVRRGQRDFLTLHLGRWVGSFTQTLAKQDNAGSYVEFARLLEQVISNDMQLLQSMTVEEGV